MDSRNIIFAIAALLIFAAGAYLVYEYGLFLSEDEHQEELEFTEAEEKYLDSLEFNPGENYTRVYAIDADGLEKTLKIIVDGTKKYLEFITPFHTEKIYYLENESIMCIKYEKKNICSIVDGETLNSHLSQMERNFPSPELYEEELFLFEKGAIVVADSIEESNVGEYGCTLIEYELNFKKLSLEDLEEIGLSSNSPQLTIYSDYNTKLCIDGAGDQVFKNFTYLLYGVQKYHIRTLLEKTTADEFEVPTVLTNESEVLDLYESVQLSETQVYECMYDEDPDSCFKEAGAYSGKSFYCELAGEKKDDCMLIVSAVKLDVELCPLISNNTKKDDCYLEIAVRLEDPEICDSIEEEDKKEECSEVSTPELQ